VAELLEREGWVVFRSAGSRGPIDLLALRAGDLPLAIQVKYGTGNLYRGFPPHERSALLALAAKAGAMPMLCRVSPRKRPVWVPGDEWPENAREVAR